MSITTLSENLTNDLLNNILNDVEQGLPRDLVVSYWTAKQNAKSGNSPRPRAVADNTPMTSARALNRIRNADNDRIIALLAQATVDYSYNSIARAIYGEDADPGKGFKIRKWALGITNPMQRSIEEVRQFLIDLANGQHQDILEAPGGNRRS